MKNIIELLRKKISERVERNLLAKSKEVYQIREYMGKLWLTHNGGLVCPTSMLNGDTLEALAEMRSMYVVRNKK